MRVARGRRDAVADAPGGGGAREGELFIFANGSIVGWGLEEADLKTFAAQVTKRVPGLEVNPLAEPETEELEFVTDSAECVAHPSSHHPR